MDARTFGMLFREPYDRPEDRGGASPRYRLERRDGMIVEKDVAVTLRDGVRIFVDVFRPADDRPAAPIIAWSPYGKHIPNQPERYVNAGIDPADVNADTAFEAPNPHLFVPRGFAVIVADIRGTWYCEGDATFISQQESEDFFDLIEWAGTQPWSNGKVGLSGVSYLTVSQWRVAGLHPPHLAAINPWEGWTDTYREVCRHGGIPDTSFWPYIHRRWGASTTRIEDLAALTEQHPLFDEYWASKVPDLEEVTVPAYVVACWADQGLHLRGTLEGYKRISSEQKWLEVHGRKKWAYYYAPDSVRRQLAFFDHFLRDIDNEVPDWPRVNLEIRERYFVGEMRAEGGWPIKRTQYRRLYLNPDAGTLEPDPPASVSSLSYDATDVGELPGHAAFTLRFDEDCELTGHMSLHLYLCIDEGDDADIFVGIQKLDRDGAIVPFAYYSQFDDGPVALGWLRSSHREIDDEKSTEFQPVLTHERTVKLTPGEVTRHEIEIWPSSTLFRSGESLRLVIQGTDINRYSKETAPVYFRHEASVNRGRHTVFGGGEHASCLVVPVIPAA